MIVPGSLNTNLPGAAQCLRTFGLNNYWGGMLLQSGFYVNLVTAPGIKEGPHITNPLSSYSTLNNGLPIPGYDNPNILGYTYNTSIWCTWVFYTSTSNPIISDPYIVFKDYLTTPMMNFYLNSIPGIISNNIPQGKTLCDFNIQDPDPIMPILSPNQSPSGYSVPAMIIHYGYFITTGDYIKTYTKRTITGGISHL